MENTGKKVSDAILQRASVIVIGGREYSVAPPTYGTLLRLSEYVSRMPAARKAADETAIGNIIGRIKDEAYAPAVLAILVLGAKRCDEPYKEKSLQRVVVGEKVITKYKLGFIPVRSVEYVYEDRGVETSTGRTELEYLTDVFMNEASVSEVSMAIAEIVNNRMEIGFFLNITDFLKGVNITKPTKETKATVHGH
jgi:hypothetical protein